MASIDIIADLGALALGSRLKRLADRLMQEGVQVYRISGADFQPRWFPLFYCLAKQGPDSVVQLARNLGVSHPSVNQIAKELKEAGLVAAYKDARDKRRRVLALTGKGKQMLPVLEPVWADIERSLASLVQDADPHLLETLTSLERSLDQQSFADRFSVLRSNHSRITIRYWEPVLAPEFARINEEWISDYFQMEEADRHALEHPREYIIEPGGEILFAQSTESGEIVGTCALIRRGDALGELAKMGVTKSSRGTGAGKALMTAAIEVAKRKDWKQLYLETNSRLVPALTLYRQAGFVQKPSPFASDYARADVYMELNLLSAGISG